MTSLKSVYGRDYISRPVISKPDYPEWISRNPIEDSFIEHIKLDSDKGPLKPAEEYLSDYVEGKFQIEHPHLAKRYLSTKLDTDIIDDYRHSNRLTMYNVDFCDNAAVLDKSGCHQDLKLNVQKLPETTYNQLYRDPTLIKDNALQRRSKIIPPSRIAEDKKFLTFKTGTTQYSDVHGKLGLEIIENHLLGDIVHPKCTCLHH